MKKSTLFGTLFLTAFAAVAVSASAGPHHGSENGCRRIHARIADALTADGCASPVGLCTSGTVTGSGLDGSLSATVMNIAPGATAGTSSLDSFDAITTAHGTLYLNLSGVFDPVHGAVVFVAQSPSGTGRFEGVTGRLYVNGGAAEDGGFESDLVGELCFPNGDDD